MKEWFGEWQSALQAEIASVKKRSDHGIRLYDGRILFSQNGQTIAQFSIDQNMRIPEGSPITLHVEPAIKGTLLSFIGTSVVLDLDAELEEMTERAIMTLEPWRLLEKLGEKLEEAEEDTHKKQQILWAIAANQPDFHPQNKAKSTLHELFLRVIYNQVTYLWGPPGTGKTYTLARLAAALHLKGKKVLVLSHSNAAIDVLMLELAEFLQEQAKWTEEGIIRYGYAAGESLKSVPGLLLYDQLALKFPDLAEKMNKGTSKRAQLAGRLGKEGRVKDVGRLTDLEEKMALLQVKWNEKERKMVAESNVIGTTLSKATLDQTIQAFDADVVIVDEASMAHVPQIAFAATLGKHMIVCGDFKQLPAVTTSHHPLVKKWLGEDVFLHAGIAQSVALKKPHPHLVVLSEQRRMHPAISAFTNVWMYDSYVRDHESVLALRQPIANARPFKGEALKMINTNGLQAPSMSTAGGSRFHLLSSLLSLSLMLTAANGQVQSIGYITPYRAQAEWMVGMLEIFWDRESKVRASTIHRFQGSESDVLIFDAVDHDRIPGRMFKGPEHRRLINVAITRARGMLIHLQNEEQFKKALPPSNAMVQFQRHSAKMNAIIKLSELPQELNRVHKQISWHETPMPVRFEKDLASAKRSIDVYMSTSTTLHPKVISSIRKAGIELVRLYGSAHVTGLAGSKSVAPSLEVTFPLIVIDEQVSWINLPLQNQRGDDNLSVRVLSKKFTRQLLKQLEWT
ncbi:DEAD/DEAH box helicase [Jeotgalibacillus marinus]|uniref:AAA domain-containing protein n=1 Tax=Jeotgalibacillus marinus TaxID=86667 RepID=A0ABV3Q5X5_9BACL